jgi:hypothetical protein
VHSLDATGHVPEEPAPQIRLTADAKGIKKERSARLTKKIQSFRLFFFLKTFSSLF